MALGVFHDVGPGHPPVTIEVNAALPAELETLGKDPYGAGWLVRIRPDDPAEMIGLLDAAAYEAVVKSQPH